MIGQTISHYRILEKIGDGGMWEVYLAEDTSLDRKVALKFLPRPLQDDEIAHRRFLREAKSPLPHSTTPSSATSTRSPRPTMDKTSSAWSTSRASPCETSWLTGLFP